MPIGSQGLVDRINQHCIGTDYFFEWASDASGAVLIFYKQKFLRKDDAGLHHAVHDVFPEYGPDLWVKATY